MKLDSKNASHIYSTVPIASDRNIVLINVTENDGATWTDKECNYNIYCLDEDKTVVWQVKESNSSPVSIFGETDCFCYMSKDQIGEITASRFSGYKYRINPETGEATRIGFHK